MSEGGVSNNLRGFINSVDNDKKSKEQDVLKQMQKEFTEKGWETEVCLAKYSWVQDVINGADADKYILTVRKGLYVCAYFADQLTAASLNLKIHTKFSNGFKLMEILEKYRCLGVGVKGDKVVYRKLSWSKDDVSMEKADTILDCIKKIKENKIPVFSWFLKESYGKELYYRDFVVTCDNSPVPEKRVYNKWDGILVQGIPGDVANFFVGYHGGVNVSCMEDLLFDGYPVVKANDGPLLNKSYGEIKENVWSLQNFIGSIGGVDLVGLYGKF